MQWEASQRTCNDIMKPHKQAKKKKINREFCKWWSLMPYSKKTYWDILSELNVYPVCPKAIEKKCPESVRSRAALFPAAVVGCMWGLWPCAREHLLTYSAANLKNTCVTSVFAATASVCQVILTLTRKKPTDTISLSWVMN